MRATLKRGCDALAFLLVLPAFLLYQAARAILGAERAFPGWSQAFSLVPGLIGVFLRRAFYRLVLARCGADACISFGTLISHPTARLGRGVYVGPYCCLGGITLEDDVILGSGVSVTNGARQHGTGRLDIPIREQPGTWASVRIGRDCWIGERAVVMADIGEQCIVGAGSVVVHPLPSRAVAAGVPARILRYRDDAAAKEMSETAEPNFVS
jgi:acetyltransferase-like isoleucine patch superfamily enzyme